MNIKEVTGFLLLALAASACGQPADIRIQANVPNDNRSPGNLVVELNLAGKDIAGITGIRCILEKAVDDTGKNLILKGAEWDLTRTNQNFTPTLCDLESPPGMQLILDLPAKQASKIKALKGQAEIFKPANDPASVITMTNVTGQSKMDLSHPALTAAQIKMTVTPKEYNGKPGFGISVSDPSSKLFYFEFLDSKGEESNVSSSVITAGNVSSYEYREPLPKGASLRIYVPTPKSLVKLPVDLKDIALTGKAASPKK